MSMSRTRTRVAVATATITAAAAAALVAATQTAGAASQPPADAIPVPAASFAVAATASGAQPETPPRGVNVAGCVLTSGHAYPVVLINGTFETMESSFGYLGPKLADAGYCVYGYNYNPSPLPPVQAVGPVDDGVTALSNEINKVKASTGASKVDLVGYSQGGLIAELYTKFGGASNVHSVTGLAPSTHGTTISGIGTLAAAIPGAPQVISAAGCQACSDQLANSPVIQRLNTGPVAVSGIPYTVIDTRYEDVVTPAGSSFILEPGVVNEYVQSFAPLDTDDHVVLPYDIVTESRTVAALKRAAAAG